MTEVYKRPSPKHRVESRIGDEPVAELHAVSKAFAGKSVLQDLSLVAYPGEVLLIRGENGSGKSTALRILAGLEKQDKGGVHILGKDVSSLSLKKRQRNNASRVGVGYQEPMLDKGFTVFDNLVGLGQSFGKKNTERIGLVAARLGLFGKFDEQAATLSGGEKQRLALGRILVTEPELLLLDEPTAAVHPEGKEAIYGLIREFNHNDGSTAVIVSHDIQAIDYADRVVELMQGRLHELPH